MTLIPRAQAANRPVLSFRIPGEPAKSLAAKCVAFAGSAATEVEHAETSAAMATRITELEALLANEREKNEEARAEAFAQGRAKGLAEAETDADDKLRRLSEGISRAAEQCAAGIDGRGDLAVAIALAALDKILGDAAGYAEMVSAVVRQLSAQLETGTVVRVRVSAQDFADDSALTVLAQERHGLRIERDEQLAPGSCLFDLTLGEIDASIPLQAMTLDRLLAPLASAGADGR